MKKLIWGALVCLLLSSVSEACLLRAWARRVRARRASRAHAVRVVTPAVDVSVSPAGVSVNAEFIPAVDPN